jgi:hypothetical protein
MENDSQAQAPSRLEVVQALLDEARRELILAELEHVVLRWALTRPLESD